MSVDVYRGDMRAVVLALMAVTRHLVEEMRRRGVLESDLLLAATSRAAEECRLPGNGPLGTEAATVIETLFANGLPPPTAH